jgi:hypothetical protein
MELKDNYYHNLYHAIDSIHSYFYLLNISGLIDYLKPADILVIIITTLCHDLGHFGVNNRFLVNIRHKLAIQYNDICVLEQMHSAKIF